MGCAASAETDSPQKRGETPSNKIHPTLEDKDKREGEEDIPKLEVRRLESGTNQS